MTRSNQSPLILAAVVLAAAGLAAGCVAYAPRPRPGPVPPVERAGALDSTEVTEALARAHNRERTRAGRPPLVVSEALTAAARRHADDMAARRRMSHRGSDGSSPFRRMEREGYVFERAAENVAAGQRSTAEVMAAWMASPGHRRNVLGKYDELGAACATDEAGTPYWCVTFGTAAPRRGPTPATDVGYASR
jgi:uncharacterized protein YkwD